MEIKPILSICICTYKRPDLLALLIDDIYAQTLLPNQLIIVDGDPSSGSVKKLLKGKAGLEGSTYLPSNHGNLPYQRYLGWRAASAIGSDFLLYFDDDVRLSNRDAVFKLLEPMLGDQTVTGVTADTMAGETELLSSHPMLLKTDHQTTSASKLVKIFGSGRSTHPGGLSPSGHRRFPLAQDHGFVQVQWLLGRVMLYRMSTISQKIFSEDLFAMYELRIGRGEDTFLSRQVGADGKLLLGFGLGIEHPNADLPKCYPIEAHKFGYANAYSRRFLNDHYRVSEPPKLPDRLALLKSYLGTALLNGWQAISSQKAYQKAYARGYLMGALRGVLQKPTAKTLTPEIDWWQDAEEALRNAIHIQ